MLKIKKTKIKKTKIKKTKIKKTKIKKTKIKKTKIKKTKIKKTKRNKKAKGKGLHSLQVLASRRLASQDEIIEKMIEAGYPEHIIQKVINARINAANTIARKFHSKPTNIYYMKVLIKNESKIDSDQRTNLDGMIEIIEKEIKNKPKDWWNEKVTKDSIKKLEEKLAEFLNPTDDYYEEEN